MQLTLEQSYFIFQIIQTNFSYENCKKIFNSILSDHLWEKWVKTDNNIIKYLSKLDNINRSKILNWGLSLVDGDGKIKNRF